MRTTVDLPPALHRRAREFAAEQEQSLSSALSFLVARGLDDVQHPSQITVDPTSGMPTINLGRPLTQAEVYALIDEDE